ncbi:S41 family peptidase [Ekhidna sp.]|jgi:carboxyl-terminal processing protease|uniref:S41 family peptidase n=1 Tax=Ekhidna sp. TaxID=2608089 RepID=UPI0032EA9126
MSRKVKIILPSILALVLLIAAVNPPTDRYFEILKNLDIFATLFKEVNTHYVDEINPTTLMQAGIDEMLETLDPYTNYIAADDIENYRMMTTGEYSGIGAVVERKNGISTIVMPYEGFAAHDAGLRAGDEIHAINGISLEGKTQEEVRFLMKGQSNSEITLTIKRYGQDEMFDVNVKREKIAVDSVPYAGMVTDNIGYVRLTSFTQNVGRSIGIKVLDLMEQGAESIILDLRGNPGGLLHEAVNVSNVFVEKGRKIVTQKGKVRANDWTYNTLNDPVDPDIPVVVLTDNGSASASEIVSGVMQDYDRGVLIGRKTFGKGLVQIERPLSYDAVVKITTAKYYTPTGRCIQAIDYSNRNEDGSVGKIPDSLKNEFYTLNGRKVYDGGGIDPDVEVEKLEFAPITKSLVNNDHIFYYATEYYYKNQDLNPASPDELRLSEADYEDFKQWLSGRDFDYVTRVEKETKKLIDIAKEEKKYSQLKSYFDELELATKHNKERDLETFKEEIKMLLEQEIAGRYFYEKGIIESTFGRDPDVQAAITVLNDPEKYQSILNPN